MFSRLWREFQASFTILRTLTLKNAIWPKRAAITWMSVLQNFYEKRTVFPFLKEFQASVTTLRTLSKLRIWPKRAAHGLKRATIFMESACFSVEENLRPSFTILRTLTLQNAIWPKRAPHDLSVLYNFYRKRAVFLFWKEFAGQFHDFENFDAQKCDLAKTCCDVTWKERFAEFS